MKYIISWKDGIKQNKKPIKIETNSLISFDNNITVVYIDYVKDTKTILIGLDVGVKEDKDLKHFYTRI
jgi:hypothetical protein